MKKLGFGVMRPPLLDKNDPSSVDLETLKQMVDTMIENGFTYFDTALMYAGSNSEASVRKALVDRYDRDQFNLATKLHAGFFRDKEDRDRVFNDQLERLGVDYFDYYLVHGIEKSMLKKYEDNDVFNWLLEKKAEGKVKHPGFSFHDTPELLDELLTKYPDMEFVQLQINYLDWDSDWIRAKECLEVANKHGKPVIVMEPVKGGTLANVPEEAEKLFKEHNPDLSVPSWAIRFAASQPGVMMVLSGMSDMDQVLDNTSYMKDFVPLTKEEEELCFKVADIINNQTAIPCTGCAYCVEGCPQNIPIPKYFSLYNEDMRENLDEKGWTINFTNYENLTKDFGKASECIQCAQCEGICPQHLPIIETLKEVSDHYE